jgi:hypothetical protein
MKMMICVIRKAEWKWRTQWASLTGQCIVYWFLRVRFANSSIFFVRVSYLKSLSIDRVHSGEWVTDRWMMEFEKILKEPVMNQRKYYPRILPRGAQESHEVSKYGQPVCSPRMMMWTSRIKCQNITISLIARISYHDWLLCLMAWTQ